MSGFFLLCVDDVVDRGWHAKRSTSRVESRWEWKEKEKEIFFVLFSFCSSLAFFALKIVFKMRGGEECKHVHIVIPLPVPLEWGGAKRTNKPEHKRTFFWISYAGTWGPTLFALNHKSFRKFKVSVGVRWWGACNHAEHTFLHFILPGILRLPSLLPADVDFRGKFIFI